MANRIKGEVAFSYEGSEYTLVLDWNAICDFGAAMNCDGFARLKTFGTKEPSDQEYRALMWAVLQENHPEITLRDAGRMVIPGMSALGEALAAAFPSAEGNAAGAKVARPRASKTS